MGRPTDNPKVISFKTALDKDTAEKLENSSKILEVPKAEVVRRGIHKIHDDLK